MNINETNPEDLILYAMQLLSAEESAVVIEYLAHNAGAREELSRIQGDLSLLAVTAEMHSPTGSAKTRLMQMVAQEKKITPEPKFAAVLATQVSAAKDVPLPTGSTHGFTVTPATNAAGVTSIDSYQRGSLFEQEPVRKSAGGRILPWIGWAVAAGLAVSAGNLYKQRESLKISNVSLISQLAESTAQANEVGTARDVMSAMTDATAKRVTLATKGAATTPEGRTTYSADKGVLIFTASNMEPVDTFKTYELWLIPADGTAPMPIGTFRPDSKGSANLISTKVPKGVEAKAFGVTLENSGGAETPTMPILMSGA